MNEHNRLRRSDPVRVGSKNTKLIHLVASTALSFLCLEGCIGANDAAPIESGSHPLASTSEANEFFDVCRYNATDYRRIRRDFAETYKPGLDATELIANLRLKFELKYSGPAVDLAYAEKRRHPEKERFTAWVFEKTCAISEDNTNRWIIQLLTRKDNRLTGSELRLIFDDNDFTARKQPFNFDHFLVRMPDGSEPAEKALWSLTGKGTPKTVVQQLMEHAEDGDYGELDRVPKYATGRKDTIIYWYRPYVKKHLSARMGAEIPRWRIFWIFDENDRLTKVVVK
jgi:hypothetical protein